MGQQLLIFMVISMLVGGLGGNALSKMNPFNKSNKVAIAKQESHKEEYFKDKTKGYEWKIKESSKGQTPVIKKESFLTKWLGTLVKIGAILLIGSLFLGVNLFKYVRRLKDLSFRATKTLTQVIVGTQKAKPKMNGEEKILSKELGIALDEDSKKLVREIKSDKSI